MDLRQRLDQRLHAFERRFGKTRLAAGVDHRADIHAGRLSRLAGAGVREPEQARRWSGIDAGKP